MADEEVVNDGGAATGSPVSDAEYELGVFNEDGRGVRANDGEALKWYRKAADGGDVDVAEYAIGLLYVDKFLEQPRRSGAALDASAQPMHGSSNAAAWLRKPRSSQQQRFGESNGYRRAAHEEEGAFPPPPLVPCRPGP